MTPAEEDPGLHEKMWVLHDRLVAADLPHAFGGALALAWCVTMARGTHDIDLNVTADREATPEVLAALTGAIEAGSRQREQLERDGQVRLPWGRHVVDVFLATTAFHREAATRVRWEDAGAGRLPFVDCADLAVFKAFSDRAKDWVDIEEMLVAGTLDVAWVLGTLVEHLGGADPRVERLRSLAATVRAEGPRRWRG